MEHGDCLVKKFVSSHLICVWIAEQFPIYMIGSLLQFAEILPSALILYILRKLPPTRTEAQYQPIS